MQILFIISLLLVILYIGYLAWSKKGLPACMILLVYSLPKGYQRWLWSIWLWAETLLFAPALFSTLPERFHCLAHIFVTSQLLVALLPIIKNKINDAHIILVCIACLFSQCCAALIFPLIMLIWIPVLVALYLVKRSRRFFITETVCWLSTMTAITIKLFAL